MGSNLMGGGRTNILIFMVSFLSVFEICDMRSFCDEDDEKHFETPTLSKFGDNITITVTLESNGTYMLMCNDSVIYDTYLKRSKANITTNATHFTLLTSCTEAICIYMLQTVKETDVHCQYFNVSHCQSHLPSMHLAQNSCSKCKYVIFTITLSYIFYLIFKI
ncbi:membrane protein EE56 [Elephantid betaherpesvirus 1]|uniref:Membrane protein EE56 n=1 Tax=Elephantid herpesvirus 1 TaxID=146015 RepID=M4JTR0_ELHV1|nr:membrane protein EE56 [Elephantid betaherpesvirus 1]